MEGTIELVVLNWCESKRWAKEFLKYGVKNVVCWQNSADDSKAIKFSSCFFTALGKTLPRDYNKAFAAAKKENLLRL